MLSDQIQVSLTCPINGAAQLSPATDCTLTYFSEHHRTPVARVLCSACESVHEQQVSFDVADRLRAAGVVSDWPELPDTVPTDLV